MTDSHTNSTPDRSKHPEGIVAAIELAALVRGGALSESQAAWLIQGWTSLGTDWASHPYCRGIAEHTRAVIDDLRNAPWAGDMDDRQ